LKRYFKPTNYRFIDRLKKQIEKRCQQEKTSTERKEIFGKQIKKRNTYKTKKFERHGEW